MSTPAERLRDARARKFKSIAEASRAFGLHKQNLADHEADRRAIKPEQARAYGRAFGVAPEWILFGRGKGAPESDVEFEIPLVGTVDAGVAQMFIDQADTQAGPEMIRFAIGKDQIMARVKGDSMTPRFLPGELLLFDPPTSPDELVNREVMAQIKDGPLAIKILRRGTVPGRWTLQSHNPAHDPIEDVEIEWARWCRGMLNRA